MLAPLRPPKLLTILASLHRKIFILQQKQQANVIVAKKPTALSEFYGIVLLRGILLLPFEICTVSSDIFCVPPALSCLPVTLSGGDEHTVKWECLNISMTSLLIFFHILLSKHRCDIVTLW